MKSLLLITNNWNDYGLIDSGHGREVKMLRMLHRRRAGAARVARGGRALHACNGPPRPG